MALAGVAALLAAGTAAAAEPYPVAVPFPPGSPSSYDEYDGRWQVDVDPRDDDLDPHVVPITRYRAAVHRLTAIVADSTVNIFDASCRPPATMPPCEPSRWLDREIPISQGVPVLPLTVDGPLWDYSVNGSVLAQANPLFPIDLVINLDETPDRLIIAQGVNNAGPYFHGGWTIWDEQRYNEVVADAGAGVSCIVVVTPGYKTGPDLPGTNFDPADALEQANLDEAARWMRVKAASDPRFVLADWNAISTSHPEWWLNDVHPDADGSDQYEALITRAARQCPDPVAWPAPTTTVSDKLITAAYADFLRADRVSDADLRYWRGALAASGYRSTPLYGQLTKDDRFSGELIDALYQQLLRRTVDSGALDFWRAGVEDQSTTVADLAQGILASREFQTLATREFGGTASSAFVNRAYDTVLGRSPSIPERDYWARQIDGGSTNGTVGRAIYQSAESRDRRAAALSLRYLGRAYDDMEKKYWRIVLGNNGGNDVAMAIALAKLPEYLRTAQTR